MTDDTFTPDETGVPTVSCARCGREWELDHERHTGHYPDDVTPWVVRCRCCPDGERFLSERPARRWATTHVRHTRHTVRIDAPTDADDVIAAEGDEAHSADSRDP